MASTSSWMQYTKGNAGFFVPNQISVDQQAQPGSSTLGAVASSFHGYSTTAGGNSGNGGFANGRKNYESEFCERIAQLNYFYDLKKLPDEESRGGVFYGFELQWWPNEDVLDKEMVWGHRMTDAALAKSSTFAAGLEKLPGREQVRKGDPEPVEDEDEEGWTELTDGQQVTTAGWGLAQRFRNTEPKREIGAIDAKKSVSRNNDPDPELYSEQPGTMASKYGGSLTTRNYSENPEPRANYSSVEWTAKPKPSTARAVQSEYNSEFARPGPTKAQVTDENFRIAIPRCESIILESKRPKRRGLGKGVGYYNY